MVVFTETKDLSLENISDWIASIPAAHLWMMVLVMFGVILDVTEEHVTLNAHRVHSQTWRNVNFISPKVPLGLGDWTDLINRINLVLFLGLYFCVKKKKMLSHREHDKDVCWGLVCSWRLHRTHRVCRCTWTGSHGLWVLKWLILHPRIKIASKTGILNLNLKYWRCFQSFLCSP